MEVIMTQHIDRAAAINIRWALESVGVDSDIAIHEGFKLVASLAGLAFHKGSYFHNEYLRAVEVTRDRVSRGEALQATVKHKEGR